ncbi:MAG: hypothetical protein IIX92_05385, partial [Selenomonadales bacterium]|nr:hypothetical protein [Selenomonadales bacterium]
MDTSPTNPNPLRKFLNENEVHGTSQSIVVLVPPSDEGGGTACRDGGRETHGLSYCCLSLSLRCRQLPRRG